MLVEAEKEVLVTIVDAMTLSSASIETIQDLNISLIDTSVIFLTLVGSFSFRALAASQIVVFEVLVVLTIDTTIVLVTKPIKLTIEIDS